MIKCSYIVNFIDELWRPIKMDVKVNIIPQANEFIFFNDTKKYFIVLNIVHQIMPKHKIIVVIKEYEDQNDEIIKK